MIKPWQEMVKINENQEHYGTAKERFRYIIGLKKREKLGMKVNHFPESNIK